MAGLKVKQIGASQAYDGILGFLFGTGRDVPRGKRNAFTMSDGRCAVLVPDPNQNTSANDGGDNSDIVKFHAYLLPADRSSATLKVSFTPTQPVRQDRASYCASLGSNDNLHICWRATNGGLYYRMLTWVAGTATWTVGAEETVMAAVPSDTNSYYSRRLDMDLAGPGNNPVIGSVGVRGELSIFRTSWQPDLSVFFRRDSGVWVAPPKVAVAPSSQGFYQGSEDITVACNQAGRDGTGAVRVMVGLTRRRGDGTGMGEGLWTVKVGLTDGTGALSAVVPGGGSVNVQGINIGQLRGARQAYLFSTGAGIWTAVGVAGLTPLMVFVWRFRYTEGVGISDIVPPRIVQLSKSFSRNTDEYQFMSATYAEDVALIHLGTGERIHAVSVKFYGLESRVTVGPPQLYDQNYDFGLVFATSVFGGGGSNRNFQYRKHDVLWFAARRLATSRAGSRWYYHYWVELFTNASPLAPRGVSPQDLSVTDSDRPTLYASPTDIRAIPQVRTKIEWQIAADVNFGTNLRSIIEGDADFSLALDTAPPASKLALHSEVVSQVAELFQAVWYVRARTHDELGVIGPWSVAAQFEVTHKPGATNMAPTGGEVVAYSAALVLFRWTFSDPSSSDFQTAYQILLTSLDGTETILDTGKVISGVSTAALILPVSARDRDLSWVLTVWDREDISSDPSVPQHFLVVDAPVVALLSPDDGSGRDDLLTADEQDFEVAIGSWIATGGNTTIIRSTAQAASGVASLRLTATAAGILRAELAPKAITGGQEFKFEALFRPNGTARQVRVGLRWRDINDATISESYGPYRSEVAGTWATPASLTWFSPQAATSVVPFVEVNNVSAAEIHYMDLAHLDSTGNMSTSNPTVLWQFTATLGRTQTGYRVVVMQATGIVYDSGWRQGDDNTAEIGQNLLKNDQTYTFFLYVRDSVGLETSDQAVITTSWAEPAVPDQLVTAMDYDELGYVSVTWTNQRIDTDFLSWKVYRRRLTESPDTEPVLIYQTTDNLPLYKYRDYLAAANQTYEYSVTQVAERFGSVLESDALQSTSTVDTTGTVYWLVYPLDVSLSVPLRNVTDDAYVDEYEATTYNVIGRGRHTDYGDHLGAKGSLTAKLRSYGEYGQEGWLTARVQRRNLQILKEQMGTVMLRNPFGDVWEIAMGDISIGRIAGVGVNEFVDLTIPYEESR